MGEAAVASLGPVFEEDSPVSSFDTDLDSEMATGGPAETSYDGGDSSRDASQQRGVAPKKAHLVQRWIAKGIDGFLGLTVAAILPAPVGPLLGLAYVVLSDGLNFQALESQSVGKKLLGLQTLNIKRNGLANFKDSAVRNSPLAVGMFFAVIPVWGWIFFVLVGLPLLAIEVFLMWKVEGHQRLGDVMADTEVVIVSSRTRRKAAAAPKREAKRIHPEKSKEVAASKAPAKASAKALAKQKATKKKPSSK